MRSRCRESARIHKGRKGGMTHASLCHPTMLDFLDMRSHRPRTHAVHSLLSDPSLRPNPSVRRWYQSLIKGHETPRSTDLFGNNKTRAYHLFSIGMWALGKIDPHNVPIANVDVMANARPIYLLRRKPSVTLSTRMRHLPQHCPLGEIRGDVLIVQHR